MRPADRADAVIPIVAGVRVTLSDRSRLVLSAQGGLARIEVADPRQLTGRWSLGLGWRTEVQRGGAAQGYAVREHYFMVEDGQLVSVDGQEALDLPAGPSPACRVG